ncbi:hypothetical protein V8E36_007706 [Tilletia maclaganii]
MTLADSLTRGLLALLPSSGGAGATAPTLGSLLYTLGSLSFRYSPLLAPVLIWGMDAPHGRFAPKNNKAWTVHGNYGWLVMEIVSPLTFLATLLTPAPLTQAGTKGWEGILAPQLSQFTKLPLPNRILAVLFVVHYAHRAVISPLTSPTRSRMHISVPLSAIGFNLNNGFLMGSWLGGRSPAILSAPEALKTAVNVATGGQKGLSALRSRSSAIKATVQSITIGPGLIPEHAVRHQLFWLGILGWAIGFAGNIYHDEILANLRRKPKSQASDTKAVQNGNGAKSADDSVKTRYKVPHGALFEYVSFPNYLCEWFEWSCFAFVSLYFPFQANQLPSATPTALFSALLQAPPFLFLLAEVSAMLPRAYKGHRWYRDTFGDELPKGRKAAIPFIL